MTATFNSCLIFLLLLNGCAEQTFDANNKNGNGKQADSLPYSSGTDTGDSSLPSSPQGSSPAVVEQIPSVSTDNLIPDGNAELIPAEPSIPPTVIAGASLTCNRGVPTTDVTCIVRSKGVATDVVPKHIYLIRGKSAKWEATPFKRIQIGTYLMSVPPTLPETFAVGLTYGLDQYLTDMVGDGYPEYNDLIKDGGFDNVALDNSNSSTSRISSSRLASSSPWEVQVRKGQTCTASDTDLLFEMRNVNRGGQTFMQRRTAYLDTACPSGGSANLFLMQKLTVSTAHLYWAYTSYKAAASTASADSQNVQIGFGQNGGNSVYTNITYKDTDWHIAQMPFKPDVTDVYYFATEAGKADRIGFMVDDVKVYDLGIPVLD